MGGIRDATSSFIWLKAPTVEGKSTKEIKKGRLPNLRKQRVLSVTEGFAESCYFESSKHTLTQLSAGI